MNKFDKSVYLMALGIFAMVCSELLVGGLMPQMSRDLQVGIPQIGYLITAFAFAMALGGPLLTLATMRLRINHALMLLFAIFFAGNALSALADSYGVMMAGRIITGASSGAFFGVSLSAVAQVTVPDMRARATGLALQGLMLGTALGLPLATLIGGEFGWRSAFYAIALLTAITALATALTLPALHPEPVSLRDEMAALKNPRLWFVMFTSTLIIGATFAAFSYFTPILIEVSGFSENVVPLLLFAYGGATVIGNIVVARFAQSHTIRVIVVGLLLNLAFLLGFALFAQVPAVALLCVIGVGLTGISLNPATITRVQRTGNARPLVNTLHSSFITMGVVVGSWLGGMGIDITGSLRLPLWVGALLAILALLAMLPAAKMDKQHHP